MFGDNSLKFIDGLKSNNEELLSSIPKSDLHVHMKYGGSSEYFRNRGINIPQHDDAFNSLEEMQAWQKKYIAPKFPGIEGTLFRFEGMLEQARKDGSVALCVSVGLSTILSSGNSMAFLNNIKRKAKFVLPHVIIKWELLLDKGAICDSYLESAEKILESWGFSSINCAGSPEMGTINELKDIYNIAKKRKMDLCAHIGEFSSPDDIIVGVETLGLTHITHGITAVKSKNTMDYLSAKDIILHLCPASNIKLGVVESYELYPVEQLLNNGITVTINTDDLLIFGDSISAQYQKLYNAGAVGATELNCIRLSGLSVVGYKEA